MFDKVAEWLRVSGFFFTGFLIWTVWSAEPFLANKPLDFQAAGSIVVAWAIFFYGRDRLLREDAIHKSNKQLFITAHNSMNARLELHVCRVEHTQNMNTLAYAQLLQKFGLKDLEMGNPDEAIKDLKLALEDTEQHRHLVAQAQDADNAFQENLRFNQETEATQGTWAKIVYRAELCFAIFGTLQWGYGDRWVRTLHASFPSLESWWGANWIF